MSANARYTPGKVSNKPFRDAFLRGGIDPKTIATELGWIRKKIDRRYGNARPYEIADTSRVKRLLGLLESSDGYTTSMISEDLALQLLPFFPSLDPVDVGV